MTTTRTEPLLIRPREAALLLSVSLRQLGRYLEQGLIEPVRLTPNAKRRFRAADIWALVDKATEED